MIDREQEPFSAGMSPRVPVRPRRGAAQRWFRLLVLAVPFTILALSFVGSVTAQDPTPAASPTTPAASVPPAPTPLVHPPDDGTNQCFQCHISIDDKQAELSRIWESSVHGKAGIGCADCHGGDPRSDEVTVAMSVANGYIGIPSRAQTVGLCGGCHADVDRMRSSNLPTDQYAKYYSSVHGLRLALAGDTKVAICADCHGTHAVKKASDPTADVYPLNVPKLCASCHSDPELMEPYGIPTNQYEIYEKSVHGEALIGNKDVRAPSCASCHGSHAAKPPNDTEVVEVCGRCHTATQALYEQSLHARLEAVAPKCWTCHGTHDVSQPSEALFFHDEPPQYACVTCHAPGTQALRLEATRFKDPADRRCDTCHHPESIIYSQVQGIYRALDGAKSAFAGAEQQIEAAARLGMVVRDAHVQLTRARTGLIQAQAAVHTTKLTIVASHADEAIAHATEARLVAESRLDESTFRRQAMIAVLVIIAVNIVVLYFVKRRIHHQLE
jgi:hypothetical protein